jgi:Na+-transporting NADH:ubiquinone oxidoreductase subunit D
MTVPAARLGSRTVLYKQLWEDNPIFRQVLGICSALAVTNLMFNTLLMCIGLVWATVMTNVTVSATRDYTPPRVRMVFQVLVIACYVIVVDVAIQALFPAIHDQIGPYVGLIITNCIIMGRAEAFASKNRPWPSLLDGLGAGLGYSAVLMAVAVVRETLGSGSWFGIALPLREWWWSQWVIMVMPPGAFFVLAIIVWIARNRGLMQETEGGVS